MVSKTLLVVLVAACSVHSLNAWPSDRKTTPGQAVMSREKFLGLLSKAVQDVTGEVAKSHQFVQDADAADRVGQATTKATEDVSDYTKWYTDALNEYAAHMIPSTVNTAPCVDSYMADKAGVEAYALNKAKASINTYMQDVRDTASNADTLLEKIASVQARGAAEAAKPDGEYGGDVEAILDAADGVVGKAVSNNGYINAVLSDGLDHAAEEAVLDNSDVSEDMRVLQGYAEFCMRKTAASA